MEHDGLIFDLDGTLWDSTETVAASWTEVLSHCPDVERPPTMEELRSVMGMASDQLMSVLFPCLSPEKGQELFKLCGKREQQKLREKGGVLFPEERETLNILAGRHPLFIVSNCDDGYIECFLDAHHMRPLFRDWECIGRTGRPKGENIRLIAERNGLLSPVYIGDTVLDRQAADSAGVPFLHAAYGFGKVPGADYVTSFAKLKEIF